MSRIAALREKHSRAHAYAVSILAKRNQTTADKEAFDRAMADVDGFAQDIKNLERAGLGESANENRDYRNPWTNEKEHRRAAAFGRYLRFGKNELEVEERSLLERRDMSEGNVIDQIGSYSSLGYFVPAGFVYDVEQATKWFAPLLDGSVVTVMPTATGQALPYPTSNDTNNEAELVAENAGVSSQDFSTGHIKFGAYKYSSKLVKVSIEALQDSAFNIESFLAKQFGQRFGRKFEQDFTNADGVNKPTGILTEISASGISPVIATGSSESTGGSQTGVNSIGYSDLVNLEHSVDPSYRRGAKYMFHDTTLASIKKILDKFGRPIWAAGLKDGEPDTINGYPYVINQSMPQIAASAVTVAFGDFSKFIVRNVKDMSVIRLSEQYATSGQVGFLAFARVDSRLVDAGTHPLNVLQQHS